MPKKTLGNIGARPRRPTFLRAWRKHRGLSQMEAAEKVGVSYTTIGRKENGASFDSAYLEAVAKAYDCELIDILERPPWESPNRGALTDSDQIIEAAKVEFGSILRKSIEAARGQPQAHHSSEARPQPAPQAQPRGSKLPKKSNQPKRP